MTSERRADQDRFLLNKLAAAEGRRLTGGKIVPSKLTKAHGLAGFADRSAVAEALAGLVSAGMVAEGKSRRGTSYTLTDDGAARLASLPPPEKPTGRSSARAGGREKAVADLPENPNLLPHQQAFVLLQLLAAPGRTLTDGQANKLPKVAKEDLELTGPLASQVRRKLADQGFLTAERAGRSLHVTLTDAGLAHLATLPHHPAGTFAVTGEALNALVAAATAARGASRPPLTAERSSNDGGGSEPAAGSVPVPADAAYAAFSELARERFSRNGRVPIFEVRRALAARYGAAAARHDALDPIILGLWRDGRVRLVSISDTRGATPDQLEDSITDAYETLFYMEDADGHTGSR